MELSAKIRKIRELKGISQEHIVARLGMSQAAYSRLEKDDKQLTFDKLESIAEVLEIDPFKILNFDEQMIFNNSNQAGGTANVARIENYYAYSEKEKELYESQIEELKKEIEFLKELIKNKL
jgi:transcriptional regulator with XRE-family HTH domain